MTRGSGSCSSSEDEESEESMSSVVGGCFRFKLEISGIVEGNAAFCRMELEVGWEANMNDVRG